MNSTKSLGRDMDSPEDLKLLLFVYFVFLAGIISMVLYIEKRANPNTNIEYKCVSGIKYEVRNKVELYIQTTGANKKAVKC